jgi:hypothetical protein
LSLWNHGFFSSAIAHAAASGKITFWSEQIHGSVPNLPVSAW